MAKRLVGGIIGCIDETSSWHLNGFPVVTLGQLYNVGRSPSLYCVCVVCVFFPIHSGHQVHWTYQPGSHRRKVTQDFSSASVLYTCINRHAGTPNIIKTNETL